MADKIIKQTVKTFFVLGMMLAHPTLADPEVKVDGVRLSATATGARVVLDISAPASHVLFQLKNPNRVVVDLKNTEIDPSNPGLPSGGGPVSAVRVANRDNGDARVVLDLLSEVEARSFLVPPDGDWNHRLVIDLQGGSATEQTVSSKPQPVKESTSGAGRQIVVAVDAGHGGQDPGATGKKGVREKDVALQIARRLAKRIDQEPGMRAYMVRDGDYYLLHRQRMARARKQRADLFVSIHADAFKNRKARGSSVYILSARGASSEAARWLAAKENAADLVGGVSLDDKDDTLASVLLDLSQSASIDASMIVADSVLSELGRVGRVHKSQVQKAGFLVLKSPDIPSILVETAFISNPDEEKQLRNSRHQDALAAAIMNGVRGYFRSSPPPGTLLAMGGAGGLRGPVEHVIVRGDTLSDIANRYNVSLRRLRKQNRIKGDRIRVGQVLNIPSSSGS
jgi:N-acetylmuramoyl-L-alanine amidase